jgi:hypothetical protein
MMPITEEGRATVASLEFAEDISKFMTIYHQRGESEEDIENFVRLWIALALTEQEELLGSNTSEDDAAEIAAFMVEHFDEIESAFDKCMEILKLHHMDRN